VSGPPRSTSEDDRHHQDGVGEPDGLERLWTPHRMAYISGENKPDDASAGQCPFCRIPSLGDEEGLVVHRGETAYVVLNLYPYSSGHLMACPYRHVADYPDLTEAETHEVAALTKHAMRVIRAVSGAHGFNIGMNQGAVAGAGIAAHLHQHVVPRWGGDANFMPIIGRTKTLPQLLNETWRLFSDAWPQVGREEEPGAESSTGRAR
jgi:ATP adenylyltransferase